MTEFRMRQFRQFSQLSFNLEKMILGSLLGDGSLGISKNDVNARYQERHSIKQKDYFLWKIDFMKPISSHRYLWYQPSKKTDFLIDEPKMRYCSRALPDLTILSNIVNDNGKKKKITRKWLNSLTPLSLAVLWCDDGSLISNTRKGVFCLESFSYEEQRIFVRYLKVVWGLTSRIYPIKIENKKSQSKIGYRVFLDRANLKKFLKIILPHIPVKSMLYKATLLYKNEVFQQRWISEMAELTTYSRIELEELVQDRKKSLKHFRE